MMAADCCARVECAERTAHGGLYGSFELPSVPESDFCFCRVDVYVNGLAGKRDREKERGPQTSGDRGAICGFSGADDPRVADGATIHCDEYSTRCRTDVGGPLDETGDVHRSGHIFHVEKRSRVLPTPAGARRAKG